LETARLASLMVRFWYRLASKSDCTAADYTSPQVWSYFGATARLQPTAGVHALLPQRKRGAGSQSRGRADTRVHGHVHRLHLPRRGLASRGYVVASVDHTFEATAVEMPDGRLQTSHFGSHLTRYTPNDVDALTQVVRVRLDDLRLVLDELARLDRCRTVSSRGGSTCHGSRWQVTRWVDLLRSMRWRVSRGQAAFCWMRPRRPRGRRPCGNRS
jgi:hypothetical protein